MPVKSTKKNKSILGESTVSNIFRPCFISSNYL